jgi:DNA-binding transcriptional ArsR family regulator
MSQSLTAASGPAGRGDFSNSSQAVLSDDDAIEQLLTAFNDDDCRRILEAVADSDDCLTAAEISERCDVPLSTTYRKLELLTEAALLDEQLQIRRSGRHTSEYALGIDDVRISVGLEGGIALEVSQ